MFSTHPKIYCKQQKNIEYQQNNLLEICIPQKKKSITDWLQIHKYSSIASHESAF